MKLDVGCGVDGRGDVNCDLFVVDNLDHRNKGATNTIPVHTIPNFIKCDAVHLPFISEAFDEVFCAQVIEHVPNPLNLFKELVRVSKDKVTVETSHWIGEMVQSMKSKTAKRWLKKHHITKMNFKALNRLASVCKCVVEEEYITNWIVFPHSYLPWVKVPGDIGVVCEKSNKQAKLG